MYSIAMTGTDVASRAKHIRFEPLPEDFQAVLDKIKEDGNFTHIVEHKVGKKGEHPHLHCWYMVPDKAITCQALRDRFKKDTFYSERAVRGNGFWSIRAHNDISKWCEYVLKNITVVIHKDTDEFLKQFEKPKNETIEINYETHKKPPRPSMRERFFSHCMDKFTPQIVNGERITASALSHELVHYFEGAVNDFEAVKILRMTHYRLANDEDRSRFVSTLAGRFRSTAFFDTV